MTKGHILVVDDEKMIRWTLDTSLTKEGYQVTAVETGEEALEYMTQSTPDVVILDITLPGIDGIDVLKNISESDPSMAVIMITAHKEVALAVSAMKLGAFDYVEKPFDVDRISILVKNALEKRKLSSEVEYYRKEKREQYGFDRIVAKSRHLTDVVEIARKVANSEATTVLLQGESGTGKDLVAMAIHYESSRATKPFMPINVTALPGELLESELMGYEKGAFTDAKSTKKGLFEVAKGGTIYLDEVGDMKHGLQAKLLRFIETKSFKRVGGHTDIEVDVRIIAATNQNLEGAVKEGTFREDLFYRLNVIPIFIPPLRDRREDIIPIANHYLALLGEEFKRRKKGFTEEALSAMVSHDWPGNVRELKNSIERALILGTEEYVGLADLSFAQPIATAGGEAYSPGTPDADESIVSNSEISQEIIENSDKKVSFQLPDGGVVLDDVELEFIKQALEKTGGNQTKAAGLLGLTRDALRYRMKKFGLDKESG